MNLVTFARLLHRKINSAHRKAKNPFIDSRVLNPFNRPIYTTFVWIEADDEDPKSFNNKGE